MDFFFSVGEPSGDLHGANLIRDLRERLPDARFHGFGGPKMITEGLNPIADLTQYAVMFPLDTIRHLRIFWNLYQQARKYLRDNKIDAVVLIDFAGFNWWIAAAAKREGIPVYFYGVPQMWAWAGWRISRIRRYIDHVLCKLPFEKAWFEERDCRATYVGHPYFDELQRQRIDERFLNRVQSEPGALVTLLPGSRTKEVRTNLQVMLNAAARVQAQLPETRFAIACYKVQHAEYAKEILRSSSVRATIYFEKTPELIRAAKCCIACSGSVSLELLGHLKPTVIHYHLNRGAYFAQRYFLKARFITLVNLLATDLIERRKGEPIFNPDAIGAEDVPFPEYLTHHDKSQEIAAHITHWLSDEPHYQQRVTRLRSLKERFGQSGASARATDYLCQTLGVSASDVQSAMRASDAA
jgi:lipid-A-disaccharide synthase